MLKKMTFNKNRARELLTAIAIEVHNTLLMGLPAVAGQAQIFKEYKDINNSEAKGVTVSEIEVINE